MTPPRVAAFFDFDRTVIDADGGVLFGYELLRIKRRRVFDERRGTLGWLGRIVAFYAWFLKWTLIGLAGRALYYSRIIKRSTLVNLAYSALRGWSVDELRLLARDFVDEVLVRHAYPEALDRMKDHRRQGHLVVIATTNMRLLVENFRAHAPVDDVIGVEILAREGRTIGKVTGPRFGLEKAQAIRDYAHARNISLPKSYAYTDHYSDHFILALVGYPFVVNPGWHMRRYARAHRVPQLSFAPLAPTRPKRTR